MPYSYYIYYRVDPARTAASERRIGELLEAMRKATGVAGRLMKKRDEFATTDDVTEDDRSVRSGRTIDEVGTKAPRRRAKPTASKSRAKRSAVRMPRNVQPMLATLVDRPRDPVLVLNGDILTTLDFGALYAEHQRWHADATISAFTREVKIDFGVLEFADDPTTLSGYREKPTFTFDVPRMVWR